MSGLIEQLLQPVSVELPSGPDLSNDPRFDEMERIVKGKPEVEIGTVVRPAEPPDWGELKEKSEAFLGQSKHLRVAVILCCSLLKTGGLAGFRDGLQLVKGLVEQYWPTVYPPLDHDENDSPTWRLNLLGALTSPRGTRRPDIQQWLAIIDYLYETPLCKPKGGDVITLSMVEIARKPPESKAAEAGTQETPPPAAGADLAKLGQAFRAVPMTEMEATYGAVAEAIEALSGIDRFLTEKLGADNTIGFEDLRKVLLDIQGVLKPYLTLGAADAGAESVSQGDASADASQANIRIAGPIRSREDVGRAIDSICEYYRQVEPCSPVPYLLRRAQMLATMNFVQAVQELNLATVDSLRPSMGSAIEPSTPAVTEPSAPA